MKVTSCYYDVCLETWLNCERVLISLFQKQAPFSKRTTQVVEECSNICFGTLEALKSKWTNINEVALLCVGICEECAEVCERYNDATLKNCAETCRKCSATLSSLASSAM